MADDRTRTKTLWSETQLEVLYGVLEKNGPDAQILDIVRDLAGRGLPPRYLVEKVRDKCGMRAASRLNGLVASLKQ